MAWRIHNLSMTGGQKEVLINQASFQLGRLKTRVKEGPDPAELIGIIIEVGMLKARMADLISQPGND